MKIPIVYKIYYVDPVIGGKDNESYIQFAAIAQNGKKKGELQAFKLIKPRKECCELYDMFSEGIRKDGYASFVQM